MRKRLKKCLSLLLALALALTNMVGVALADAETPDAAAEEAVEIVEAEAENDAAEAAETEAEEETVEAAEAEVEEETVEAAEAEVEEETVEAAETEAEDEAVEATEAEEEVIGIEVLTVEAETLYADAVASGTCGDDLTWTLTEDGVLTISGTGDMWDNERDPEWGYYSKINSVIIEDGVTSVASGAFSYCYNLTSIIIPDSVTSINSRSFTLCYSLTSVIYTGTKDQWQAIDVGGYNWPLYGATICDSDGNELFEDDDILASGTCGDDLTWVLTYGGVLTISGTGDMDDYWDLSEYWDVNSESLFTVNFAPWDDYAEGITSLIVEEGVTSIGSSAFGWERELYDFTSYALTNVTISGSVTSIKESAFDSCPDLSSITFEGDAPEFSEYAFYDVTATAYYPTNNDTWTEDVMQDYGGTITWTSYGATYEVESDLAAEADIPVNDLLTEEEITSGSDIKFVLSVEEAADTVTETEKTAIAAEAGDNVLDVYYMSIDLTKYVDDEDGVTVTETASEITITVAIPDSLITSVGDTSGSYCVIRYHDGTATTLEDQDDDDSTVTFATDKFSTYAIAFVADEAEILMGDLNTDGDVNGRDLIFLRQYLAQVDNVTINVMAADLNGDDDVNGKDLIYLRVLLAG